MNSLTRALLCGTSAIAISTALVLPAFAADGDNIETVVVTGIRGSLRDSLAMKRKSPLVTENISTKDIGQLPDVTIAEELNRLPGVNTQRDRGNASQASIRGLGPRFVLGLVNGREMASSEPTQDVRWEIFPSEILGGVQVYKTQDASLIPGGIAATIDIRTTDPLNYEGPSVQMRVGPTYNDEAGDLPHYDGLGFRGSAGYIGHLNDNLAVAIAGSVQREKNGFPDMTSWGENQCGASANGAPGNLNAADEASGVINCSDPASRADATPTPWGGQTEIKLLDQDRSGLAGAATWRASSELVIKADALWSNYQINEHQIQQWYNAGNTWGNWQNSDFDLYHNPGSSFTLDNQGHVVAARLDATSGGNWLQVNNYLAHYQEAHTEIASGLNFDWTHGSWNAKVDVSHSEAWRNNRWLAFGTAGFTPVSTFDYRANVDPEVSTPGFNPADVNSQVVNQQQDVGPEFSRDHINAVTFDASDAIDGSFFTSFDFGGRFSDRYKSHHNFDYLVPILNGGSVAIPASLLEDFRVSGYNTPELLYGNFDAIESLVYGPLSNTLPGSATLTACGQACATNGTSANSALPFDNLPNRWQVKEITGEGYAKVDFAHDVGSIPMTGNLGVRIDDVGTTSTGFQTTDGGVTFQPVDITNHYTEVLPSLNMNFHLADDQLLRFGAGIATSRPPLDALRTGYSLNPLAVPTPTGTGGNPTLKPFKSNQVDLDYEWYFHEESLFSAALYYKDITTFIGIASSQQVINGTTYTISSPANGKGGGVRGIELTFQSRFYFLPPVFKDFGVYTNYSFADSGIKEFTPQYNPYPMGGLTKHTAEADLFYNRDGFEARAAFKYHSSFTLIPGWTASQLFSLAPERTLDVSASYQWNEHIGLRFQIGNVTNEVSRESSDNDPNDLARYDTFGRRYLLDISYKD